MLMISFTHVTQEFFSLSSFLFLFVNCYDKGCASSVTDISVKSEFNEFKFCPSLLPLFSYKCL